MTISNKAWNEKKAEIYNLYYKRDNLIKEVIRVIKARGFSARYIYSILFYSLLIARRKTSYFRQFKKWGDVLNKKQNLHQDPALRALVSRLYYENIKHLEILRALQQFEGYLNIQGWQLRKIRQTVGLIYRRLITISSTDHEKAYNLIRTNLKSSLITQ